MAFLIVERAVPAGAPPEEHYGGPAGGGGAREGERAAQQVHPAEPIKKIVLLSRNGRLFPEDFPQRRVDVFRSELYLFLLVCGSAFV